jgi:hypothetical protein
VTVALAALAGLALGLAVGWLTWGVRTHRLEWFIERELAVSPDDAFDMGRRRP